MNKGKKKLYEELFKHLNELIAKGNIYESIYGDQFWRFSEMGITLIKPEEQEAKNE